MMLPPATPIVLVTPLASQREEQKCTGAMPFTPAEMRVQMAGAVQVYIER